MATKKLDVEMLEYKAKQYDEMCETLWALETILHVYPKGLVTSARRLEAIYEFLDELVYGRSK